MRKMCLIAMLLSGASVVWADAPDYARRCAAGDRELPAAKAGLTRLDDAITKAAPDAPVAPLTKELEALLATPCFRLAEAMNEPGLDGATTLALKRWWSDGGHDWLSDQLEQSTDVTFPPTLRKTLDLDNAPKHPLARLLCKANDAKCGKETEGWIARAERAFRERAEMEARWRGSGYTVNLYSRGEAPTEDDPHMPKNPTLDVPLWRCAFPGKGKKPQKDFRAWQDCVGALRTAVTLFPAGSFRAPTSGWLVVRGRRGHYEFCDGVTAFDLASGAYYASKSCSGLALQANGAVDASKTDAARTPSIEIGRVPVDNLREAAWMMMLAQYVDDTGYASSRSFPIPPGLDVKIDLNTGTLGGIAGGGWGSSAQTQLSWIWVDNDALVARGTLTWPDSSKDPEDHAAELLRIAEGGLVEGCAPAPLPNPILKGCGKGGVSSLDANAADLCKLQADLSGRLAASKGSGCRR